MAANPHMTALPSAPAQTVRVCAECGFASVLFIQGRRFYRGWHHKPGCPNDGKPTGEKAS
jgi:hypothetical protein